MIKMKVLVSWGYIVLYICLMFSSTVSAQWRQLKGIYGGNIDSFACDGEVVYAGTDRGGVYVSYDNGFQWKPLNHNIKNGTVVSIVIDGDYIYAGGDWSLSISSDKGRSWRHAEGELWNCYVRLFKYKNKIFAGTSKGLHYTSNNGIDWNFADSRIVGENRTTFAGNDSTIIVSSGSKIFYSIDEGITWNYSGRIKEYHRIVSLTAIGSKFCAGLEDDGVYISADQGKKWEMTTSPYSTSNYLTVAGSMIINVTPSAVYISADEGKTWKYKVSDYGKYRYKTAAFNGNTLFVGAYYGGIFCSDDMGNTWYQRNNGLTNINVRALKARGNEIFAGTDLGEIYHSPDNGLTWMRIGKEVGSINAFEVGKFGLLAANGDFTGGSGLHQYVKNDTGWHKEKTIIPTTRIKNLYSKGSNIYGASRGVMHSSNFGETWSDYRGEIMIRAYSIKCVTTVGNIIIAGSDGIGIYRSSNNGVNWELPNYGLEWWPGNMVIYDFAVLNSKVYAATYSGVYVSEDQGIRWNRLSNGLPSREVKSFAQWGNKLFVGINYYGVYLSEDYGASWKPFSDELDNKLINRITVNGSWLFAATEGYGLWRYPLGSLVGIKDDSSIPQGYALEQNYPNPCNPTSKISFRLPKSTRVRLVVYDSIGREILSILDSILVAGNHEVLFDGTNLASGLYFYRLITPDFSAARKIILLK